MTRRYDRSRLQRDERINWSLEELKELINNKNSQVHVERTKRHIALYPYHLYDLKKSLHEILGAEINRYNQELKGLLLAYKNPKLLSKIGAILYDTPFIHVDVEADFYIFKPEIDSILKGIINKKADNHIGVLVHKVFNVSIPKGDEEDENWLGNHFDVGDEVKFTVKQMDFKGRLPFIRGTLISSDEAEDENDGASVSTSTRKKSRKHKFTEEELDLPDESPPENSSNDIASNSKIYKKKTGLFQSINASSSESEEELEKLKRPDKTKSNLMKKSSNLSSNKEEEALNSRKKMIDAMKAASSSDSSDSEPEVPEKASSKKSSKSSAAGLRFTENLENNKPSVLENAALDSIKADSPKKSKNSLNHKKKHKIEEFPGEITAEEEEELPVVLRKRKHSESQNPDNSDDSKKMRKSKKSKKSSANEDLEQDSMVKKKVKREKESKDLDDNSVSEKVETEYKSAEPEEEDSDDDMSHFLPLRKIKVENNENWSKTAPKDREIVDNMLNGTANDEESTSAAEKNGIKTVNSSDDSDSEPESPKNESPKKSSKYSAASLRFNGNLEDDKHSVLENTFDSIKTDSPKKSKNSLNNKKKHKPEESPVAPRKRKHSESQNPENSDDSRKIRKSKKSKKSSISENSEQDSSVKKKVKREKESKDLDDHSVSEKDETESKAAKEAEEEDSENDMSHFLPLRKIKVEKDENRSETVQKAVEIVDNSVNDTVNLEESSSPTKKSKKKKKKHREDDDVIDSINVDVKSEEIKEEKLIKKSEKSKKKEILQEEDEGEGAVADKIKREKEDVMSVKSPRILNLQIEDSDSDFETREIKNEDTSKRKKSKKTSEMNGAPQDDEIPSTSEVKSTKKKARRKKSGNVEEEEVKDDVVTISHDFPSPTRVVKVEKTKVVKASRSQDDNGELSDASSSRSRILIKKEESVFFGNIKIKQELYPSDVEFSASKRRQREQDNSNKNAEVDDISIKYEESVDVKSEEIGKTRKIKIENSQNDLIVKNESDVKSKKKTKTIFSE